MFVHILTCTLQSVLLAGVRILTHGLAAFCPQIMASGIHESSFSQRRICIVNFYLILGPTRTNWSQLEPTGAN